MSRRTRPSNITPASAGVPVSPPRHLAANGARRAEMLAATGKAILANEDRYGAWLDAMTHRQVPRAQLTVEQLREPARREPLPCGQAGGIGGPGTSPRLGRSRVSRISWTNPASLELRAGRRAKKSNRGSLTRLTGRPPSPWTRARAGEGFAHILDNPDKLQRVARGSGAARPQAREANAQEPGGSACRPLATVHRGPAPPCSR